MSHSLAVGALMHAPMSRLAVHEAPVDGGGEVIALPDTDRLGDAELVRRARTGDAWATERIYRRHVRLVANAAHRLLRNRADVDDVVQETFLIAFERLDRLVEPAALRGWLVQIAISRVHRRFRWRRLTGVLSGNKAGAALGEQASTAASPEQLTELALIDRVLDRMPLKLRTPWVLRHVLGCSLDDAAVACDCSLATIKRRIADAESRVASHLARHGKGAP
jgi:RNA polymerase sigma-70 factor (ECF subfamily)